MTVERAIYYQQYIGLSTDDKPAYDENFTLSLMPGARFYETDTLKTYIWDGDSWRYIYEDVLFLHRASQGAIKNYSTWYKTGYNEKIDSGASGEDLWVVGGALNLPIAEQGMEVRSSDILDDGAPANSGALTVTIHYLNLVGTEKSETVTMDGTTNVNTVATDIYRIQAFRIATCGAGGRAAGNIDVRNKADHTTVYSRIGLGYTRARNSGYSVPKGKTLYITSMSVSATGVATGKDVVFALLMKYDDKSSTILDFYMPYAEIGVNDGSFVREFEIPIKVPALVDLKVRGIAGNDNSICTSTLRGYLISD
jgi:hypothetical protein